jgi:hypothetical protein
MTIDRARFPNKFHFVPECEFSVQQSRFIATKELIQRDQAQTPICREDAFELART